MDYCRVVLVVVALFTTCLPGSDAQEIIPIKNDIFFEIVAFVRNTSAGCSAIDQCHGNGLCIDTDDDDWECDCNTGYTSKKGSNNRVGYCNKCAKSYIGYPNCQRRYPEGQATGLCIMFFCVGVILVALACSLSVACPAGVGGLVALEHLQFIALLTFMPSAPPYLQTYTSQFGWTLLDFRLGFHTENGVDAMDLFRDRFFSTILIVAAIFAFYGMIGALVKWKGESRNTLIVLCHSLWARYPGLIIVLLVSFLAPLTHSGVAALEGLKDKNPYSFIAIVVLALVPLGFFIYTLVLFWKVHQKRAAEFDWLGAIPLKAPTESILTRFFNLDPQGEWLCYAAPTFVAQFGVFFRFVNGKTPFLRCALTVRWIAICVLIGWPTSTAYMIRHILLVIISLGWFIGWAIRKPLVSKGENNVILVVYIMQCVVYCLLLVHYFVYRSLESPEHDLLSVLCMLFLSISALLVLFKPLWVIMNCFAHKRENHAIYANQFRGTVGGPQSAAAASMMSRRTDMQRSHITHMTTGPDGTSRSMPPQEGRPFPRSMTRKEAASTARKNFHAHWRDYLMDAGPATATGVSVGPGAGLGESSGLTPLRPRHPGDGVNSDDEQLQRHRGVRSSNLLAVVGSDDEGEVDKPNTLADLIEVAVKETEDGSIEKKFKRPGGNNPLARAILRDMGQTASTCVSRKNSTDNLFGMDPPTKPPSAPHQDSGAELDSGAVNSNEGDSSSRPNSAFSPIKREDGNSGAEHSVAPSNLESVSKNEEEKNNAKKNDFWSGVAVQDPDWEPAMAQVISKK